ncbi:helix-turn-helix domain-containing protein [Arachidicoccus sp.]
MKYNKSRAAEILKIDRKTLYNKLKEMGKEF